MANITAASMADMLKVIYPSGVPTEMLYEDCPALALIPKFEKFGGKQLDIPIVFGDPQGRSAEYASALANQTAGSQSAFNITRVNDYGIASIDGEAVDASESDPESFISALKLAMDGAMRNVTRSLHHSIYRTSGGAIGQVGTYVANATSFTLLDIRDVVFFEVGQTIKCDTVNGGGTQSAGEATVTGVNRSTGVIETGVDLDSTITGFAVNDYVFVDGDYGLKMSGFEAWCPASAPGATEFFGVNRSVDTRLGGCRYDGSAMTIEEALLGGIYAASLEGGKPDKAFVHPLQFKGLVQSLGSSVRYNLVEADARKANGAVIGFESITLKGPKGPCEVIADLNCPSNVGWVMQMDTWKLYSAGKAPKMFNLDGLPYLRVYNADALELRVLYRAQVGCKAPGWNCRVTLPSL